MMTELAPPLASIRPPSMQAVIEATGLRTLENVLSLIDPAILEERPPERRRSARAGESDQPSPTPTPVA